MCGSKYGVDVCALSTEAIRGKSDSLELDLGAGNCTLVICKRVCSELLSYLSILSLNFFLFIYLFIHQIFREPLLGARRSATDMG